MTSIFEQSLKYIMEHTVHEDVFPVVWHMLEQWPSAVPTADLLAVHDGMDREQEQDIIERFVNAGMGEMLTDDLVKIVSDASEHLATFELEIVSVAQFGYKIRFQGE